MSNDLSREEPLPGLVIWQPRRGFRFSMDPFLLASFALDGERPERFLDVGTGSGVIALLLARQGLAGEGIDVQPEWITLARRSAQDSGLEVRFAVQDIRARAEGPVALALANPPYWRQGEGPLPADPLKAASRHELHGTLAELIAGMARAAERVALVLPARREGEALGLLAGAGRPITRRVRVDRSLVLLEGRAGGVLVQDEQVSAREGEGWSAWTRARYARLGVKLP